MICAINAKKVQEISWFYFLFDSIISILSLKPAMLCISAISSFFKISYGS